MPNAVSPRHLEKARELRAIYSRYKQNEDLINIGAYVAGSDPKTDFALQNLEKILDFLQQDFRQPIGLDESVSELEALLSRPPVESGTGEGFNQVAMVSK